MTPSTTYRRGVARRRAGRLLIALSLCGATVAGACGSDDSGGAGDPPSSDGADGSDAGASTAEGSTSTTVDDRPVDRDATLRFGYGINVSRLDPHKAQIRNDLTTLRPIYDGLVDQDVNGELVPSLATKWSFNDDATALDLTLRRGVTFHDGAPFDARAVKQNIERAKTVEESTVAPELESVESVKVIDDHHVRLVLSEPNVSIVGALSDRAGMMVSPEAFDENLDKVAAGAGPFRLVSHRPDDMTVYERYDDYWDPDAAAVERLEIRVMPDSTTRLNALRSGQIDATTVTPTEYDQVQELDGVTVETRPTLFFTYMVLDRTKSEFDDVRVRRAIVQAIDREAICEGLLFGLCDVAVQPFPDGYVASDPDVADDQYPYDPEASRELLAEAGLGDGFSFTFMIPANLPPYPQVAEAIQSQLGEVGIDVELVATEPSQMADRMFVKHETDALIGGWAGSGDPSLYFSQRVLADSFANPGGDTTPEMERLYEQTISTVDERERAQVLQAASKEVVDEVLDINLYFPYTITVTTDDVVGYVTPMTGNPQFRGVGMAS